MNAEYEKQLEAVVRRELDALGELEAPPEIARGVMRVIEQRAALPWYRREWQAWPLVLQGASLVGLLSAFVFLCFGSSQLARYATLTPAAREVSGWFSLADAAWNTVNVLTNAMELAFRSLGPTVLIGSAVMLLLCYATCLGLGTIYWRLAYARR
jgi:succinate dehydrogenase/fumarate reductase cytochrome b subunit